MLELLTWQPALKSGSFSLNLCSSPWTMEQPLAVWRNRNYSFLFHNFRGPNWKVRQWKVVPPLSLFAPDLFLILKRRQATIESLVAFSLTGLWYYSSTAYVSASIVEFTARCLALDGRTAALFIRAANHCCVLSAKISWQMINPLGDIPLRELVDACSERLV